MFAHEARVYSLLGMLSVISMYYFAEIISYLEQINERENKKGKFRCRLNLTLLILINSLLIYSHYFGFFILITQLIFLVLNKKLILKYWKQVVLSLVIIGLLYTPNFPVACHRFAVSSTGGNWVNVPDGIVSIYNMIRLLSNAPVIAVFVIAIILTALVKYLINKKNVLRNIFIRLIVFWFAFLFLFMYGISYLIPIFLDRYLMPAAIAFGLFISICADYLIKTRLFRYIIPIIAMILFIATVKPDLTNKRNVEETVEKIQEIKNSGTLVLICPSHFILNYIYYYNIEVFKDYDVRNIYSNISNALRLENTFGINNIQEIDYRKWGHVVFLDASADFSFPNNNIKNDLDDKYNLQNEYKFYEIFNVYEYKLK